MELFSTFQGFSFNLPSLYTEISNQGWQIKSVKFDTSSDRYIAKGQASHGEELESWGPTEQQAVANLLMNITHRNSLRSSKLSMWQTNFISEMAQIAEAYSKAPLYEAKAATAFMELGRDAQARSKALSDHLEIILVNNPEPYPSARKMAEDVRKRRKLEISQAGIEHPIWSTEQVIAFRIAFDVLGYVAAGSEWDWEGTNRAFTHYAALVPIEAQKALFTEVIGQTAYAAYYRAYGPQKIALFPQFMDRAQKHENPHDGYRGIHPSQVPLPMEMPEAQPIVSKLAAAKPWPKLPSGEPAVDINAGYQTPYNGNPQINPQDYPLDDMLGISEVYHHANNLNKGGWADSLQGTKTDVIAEWQRLQQENPAEADKIKKAVSNAIRAACLSPQTQLHHNAIQYQALKDVGHNSTDPTEYFDALENDRQTWNTTRFGEGARFDHKPWFKQPDVDPTTGRRDVSPFEKLAMLLYQRDPAVGLDGARKQATQEIIEAHANFQHELEGQFIKGSKAIDEEMWILERKVDEAVLRWIDQVTKSSEEEQDVYQPSEQMSLLAAATPANKPLNMVHPFGPEYDGSANHKIFNQQRYGTWYDSQIKAITYLTEHLDGIVEAALWDVHVKDGVGHHFRAYVLGLDAPGVGPKVVSFMWLLLRPLTSELATIDVWMARLLKGEDALDKGQGVKNRDYFRLERELMARRDALGLQNVPLGLFQWTAWDLARTGAAKQGQQLGLGTDESQLPPTFLHQDHSAMRVLNPEKPENVYWIPPPQRVKGAPIPKYEAMTLSDPAGMDERKRWEENEARQFQAADEFPTQASWPSRFSKVAASTARPWFNHSDTGERVMGQPGQTLMAHLLASGFDLSRAWGLEDTDVGKVQEPLTGVVQ